MDRSVRDLMTELPHTIGNDISVKKASKMMHEHHCHHLPVLHSGHLVGLLSQRDLKMASAGSNNEDLKVEALMSDDPFVVKGNTPVRSVIEKMMANQIGSVIIQGEADKPWGIFTTNDALKLLVKLLK